MATRTEFSHASEIYESYGILIILFVILSTPKTKIWFYETSKHPRVLLWSRNTYLTEFEIFWKDRFFIHFSTSKIAYIFGSKYMHRYIYNPLILMCTYIWILKFQSDVIKNPYNTYFTYCFILTVCICIYFVIVVVISTCCQTWA